MESHHQCQVCSKLDMRPILVSFLPLSFPLLVSLSCNSLTVAELERETEIARDGHRKKERSRIEKVNRVEREGESAIIFYIIMWQETKPVFRNVRRSLLSLPLSYLLSLLPPLLHFPLLHIIDSPVPSHPHQVCAFTLPSFLSFQDQITVFFFLLFKYLNNACVDRETAWRDDDDHDHEREREGKIMMMDKNSRKGKRQESKKERDR